MHLLISISALSYDQNIYETCQIGEKIGEFVGYFSQIGVAQWSQSSGTGLNLSDYEDQDQNFK